MKKNQIGLIFPGRGKLKKLLRIMKVTTVLILALTMQLSATVYSQSTKFSMDFKGKTVREVMNLIEDQSRFRFFFNEDFKLIDEKVDLNVKDVSVEAILDQMFLNSEISYKVLNNDLIVLTVGENQSPLQTSQGKTVKGKVLDSAGLPLPGVTVYFKGTTGGTISNSDGTFTLPVTENSKILVFSFIGLETKEINIGNQAVVDVTMEESTIRIDEVVAIGYGVQKKESLTGAISGVTSEDLERVHSSTVSAALAGKLAGVSFRMPDGRPGSSATIQIRNMGIPLYVIDGIQKDAGQFNNISPNDIASITVLKDASAAIYGVRAANGVVVVTTKRGKLGTKNTINVDAYTGWQ